jgi:hypothetical protein
MADVFDYEAAKAAGMTPVAIQQFLDDQLTAGHAYQLPSSAYTELRMARTAQGQGQGTGSSYRGAADSGDMGPGLMDPVEWLGMVGNPFSGRALASTGQLLGSGARAAGSAISKGAQAGGGAVARGAGGAALEMGLEFLPAPARIAARAVMAALGRSGKAAATVAESAAAPVAEAIAPVAAEAGTVASRTAGSSLTREEIKDATRYWQTRTHAMMTQAGAPAEAVAQRKWISDVVGREIKSRTELTIPEWKQVHEAAGQLISEKAATEAAKKASAKAATMAEKAVKPRLRAVPKNAGDTASEARIAAVKKAPKPRARTAKGPAYEVPGRLQDQLQQSVQIQAEMDRRGLDPATQAQVWQALRTGTGGTP